MTAFTPGLAMSAAPAPRSAARNILAFARRECRDALTSRWFTLYTIAFAGLAVAVSMMSLASVGTLGFAGFGRTAAGLLNLIMLIVPLLALTAGAGSIAGERERGTLIYMLAQPVSRLEVLLGKFVGLAIAICSSLLLGFGLSAVVLAWRAGAVGVGAFLMLIGFTCMLALSMLAIGMIISVVSRKMSVATGIALFVWLMLVFLSDLGLMAGSIVFKLRVQELFALSVINPLQAFKMGAIIHLNGSLDVLGPAGTYASQTYGEALAWLLPGMVMLWGIVALAGALFIFSKRVQV